jgi:hypothetical protein
MTYVSWFYKHSNIKRIGENPVVLKWLGDPGDARDIGKNSSNNKNSEKNSESSNKSKLEPMSPSSPSSPSEEDKGEEKTDTDYGMKFGIAPKLPIHKISKEQYDSLNRKEEDDGTN